jgi:hypothetical protein
MKEYRPRLRGAVFDCEIFFVRRLRRGVRFPDGSPKKSTSTACRFFIQAAGLAWHHASACMELPKAYGITEGAFPAA